MTNVVDRAYQPAEKTSRPAGFDRPLIHTLRGVGYVLRAGE